MTYRAFGVARNGAQTKAATALQVLEAASSLEARSPNHKGER